MIGNSLPSNGPTFSPNLLTVRFSERVLPEPAMGLEVPHISGVTAIKDVPEDLSVYPMKETIKSLASEIGESLRIHFREVHFARTFQTINPDFISETISHPAALAALTQLQGAPPVERDPLGLTRTFTVYLDLDFEALSQDEVNRQQEIAELFLIQLAGRLKSRDPDKIDGVNLVPLRFAAYQPNDPDYPKQWHHKVIGSESAWDVHRGDPGIAVAVIDTGVDLDHDDLKVNILPGVNTTSRTPATLGLPKGWNVADPYAGKNPSTNQPNDPKDVHGHGTHVAGIIAAVIDNNEGGVGVAPGCKIVPIKSLVRVTDPSGRVFAVGSATEIADGIIAAAKDDRVKIINLSLGGGGASPDEFIALQVARGFGKMVTIAMGNKSGYMLSYPAAFKINRPELMDHVLCVGATTEDDFLAHFSNIGSGVDIVAPGDKIWSTVPAPKKYDTKSGTSMAAPMVAGVAALLFSRSPHLTPQLAATMIKGATVRLGPPAPNVYFGYGRVSGSGVLPK